jgi:phosphoglycerate kinase
VSILSVDELEVAGRRVFVRVDFNVPLEGSTVTDDTRIRAALPTIESLLARGARLVLASHLGRPKGAPNPAYSLEPVATRLAELVSSAEVVLADDCIGDGPRKVVGDLRDGQIAMLENLRFHAAEEADDDTFARELAKLADTYVNDAFGAAHRAHASVHALPKLMHEKAAGRLMLGELEALSHLRGEPARPFVAVLGGAKVSDKIGVIDALLGKVDTLLIGGAMANTFLAAKGKVLGKSLVEEDKLAVARSIVSRAEEKGTEMVLPVDLVVAPSVESDRGEVLSIDTPLDHQMALDIGPATLAAFAKKLARAATVFWNGPMGLFENPAFAEGTMGMARAIAAVDGYTVVGGGDSVAAVQKAALADRFKHVSTGGGASLEFMEGRKLPGVEALR